MTSIHSKEQCVLSLWLPSTRIYSVYIACPRGKCNKIVLDRENELYQTHDLRSVREIECDAISLNAQPLQLFLIYKQSMMSRQIVSKIVKKTGVSNQVN